MRISAGCSAARRAVPPSALPISSATMTLRRIFSGLGYRQFDEAHLGGHVDVARAETRHGGIVGQGCALGLRTGRGQGKDQRLGGMMGDVARHVMVLLMDMAVE